MILWKWRSWLRHCGRIWKLAGSIPDGIIGICYWLNPSGRTIILGSTQPLTTTSARNIFPGCKSRPVCRTDSLATVMCRFSWHSFQATVVSEPELYRLLTFQAPNLMFRFHCIGRTKVSVQARAMCSCFVTSQVFTVWSCQYLAHLLEDACPNCQHISKKFFSGPHGNFEEQNTVLEASRIIITYHILLLLLLHRIIL